jgi:hypothetical protein
MIFSNNGQGMVDHAPGLYDKTLLDSVEGSIET